MPEQVLELPSYYLTRRDPTHGIVLLYPVDAIAGAERSRYRSDPSEDAHARNGWAFEVDSPLTAWWTFAGPWLVSNDPIEVIRRTRPGERVRDGWQLREDPCALGDEPVSPELRAAFEDMPEQPDPELLAHHAEHDAPHVCWQCRTFVASYCPRYVPGEPVVEVQRLAGWTELPGGPDPDPAHPWTVTEPGYLDLYGAHTAHLWPGQLSGLRTAVVEALRAHPFVESVSTWDHKRTVSISIRVPFEPRQTSTTREKPTRRSRKLVEVTRDVWAINTHHSDVGVPDVVAGQSKADALARWPEAVREQVERFVPYDGSSAPCGHCRGRGTVPRA